LVFVRTIAKKLALQLKLKIFFSYGLIINVVVVLPLFLVI